MEFSSGAKAENSQNVSFPENREEAPRNQYQKVLILIPARINFQTALSHVKLSTKIIVEGSKMNRIKFINVFHSDRGCWP